MPLGGSASASIPFSCAMASRLPMNSMCAMPMFVMIADVRRGERGERRDLAGMIHAHLEDADLIAAPRARSIVSGSADVVVEIALRLRDLEMLAEHRGGEILRARLAVAAGEADDLQRQAAAVVRGELLQARGACPRRG